ncbi:MAG: DUF1819 family protein [Peptococcaceae bacterium]|nr:DUF1819 family protein [Peptococcaceae bacterium]
MKRQYTCNIMKGGAMIGECFMLLREWRPGERKEDFINRIAAENLIGKATRKRARDIINRIFFRRFFTNGETTADNLKSILSLGYTDDLLKILYYHTALSDDLLYDFVTQYLYLLYFEGRYKLDTTDGVSFINQVISQHSFSWSENIKTKTSRGLLAACRDFGILHGTVKKQFAPVHIPEVTFYYIAYNLKSVVPAAGKIIEHPHWRLFLLTVNQVEQLFLEAHQNGNLGYYSAGGITRIDWKYESFTDFLRLFTAGKDSSA